MKKLTSFALVLVLVLGMASTAYARPDFNAPRAFDFELDFSLAIEGLEDELPAAALMILGSADIVLNVNGTVVTEDAGLQLFLEVALGTGLLRNAPIRFWLDANFEDLADPTLLAVLELPPLLRVMAALEDPIFNNQFLAMDMGALLANELADLPLAFLPASLPASNETCELSQKQAAKAEKALYNFDATPILEMLRAELAELVEVVLFDFDYSQTPEGYFSGLALALSLVLDPNWDAIALDLGIELTLTNINDATVEMPLLTPENSVDLLEAVL